ncbi:MAG TPA: S41 family peptidase [Salinivirga sp.]|uniref:S41 family peptidase n=1 Tax=Salinivirga sp. TaxID=1970192 RepID=UPI002B4A448A|nr:S41 family peptidase [Salinivirga sp.]HKK60764.1 S41 family peptidase [Salinivirga sp.]
MKKKLYWIIPIFLLLAVGITTTSYKDNSFEIVKNIDIYTSLFKELNTYYVDEIDPGEVVKTSIDEMLKSLDPYTNYIPESDIEDYRFMTTGNYGGIGALIRKNDDRVMVADPYEGFPAQKAGLRAGDVLIKIDDFDTKGKSLPDVSEKLKGQPGTKINVVIKRPGQDEKIEKEITRKKIHVPAVPWYGMRDDKIGYIRLSNFTHKVSEDVKDAVLDLKSQGAESYILDLRGNPGGLLMEAVEIVNLFAPKGELIVSTKGKVEKWNKEYYAQKEPVVPQMPVVAMVNSGSASASEIVSGALQDLDRAVVVGTRTFGKGLVQTTRPLSYNARLKITTAKYYIPSGRCIQALDYSNRKEDGSVGKVPDSLITSYSTKNGRTVYDGGGIMPDIELEQPTLSKITVSLVRKQLIFDFATEFVNKNDSIDDPATYKISDETFEAFKVFLKDKTYDYKLRSEQELDKLKQMLKREKYLKIVENEIEALSKKLEHDKEQDLITFQDEIREMISEEISSRYYYQKGRIQTALQYDMYLDTAMNILKHKERYDTILTVKEVESE